MTGVPARAARREPMAAPLVVAILTLLLGIQPVTTDLYLPSLPTLQRELGAGVAAAQLTLSTLIICFGLGQLLCGPLADRFGRRPVLLIGLALYAAAGVGGALAATIDGLIAWRALQGLAMAAAVTCGRSIVRDLYAPHEGARVMSRALTGLGFIAVASPLCGGLIVERFGWHAALLALALFGAFALAVVALTFGETIPVKNRDATRPAQVLRNWAHVVGDPTFRAWAALSGCTYGGLYCLLAGSSFVFIEVLGVGRAEFGAILGSISIAYIGGTFLCRRLLRRHGLRGAVRRGAWFSLAGGVGMAALSLAGVQSVWAILLPQYLYAIGHGIHQPCGQAGAVGPFPEKAGTAASLSGFVMTVTALLAGLWLGRHLDGTVFPLTLSIGAFSVMLAIVAWTLVQRDGEPVPAARLVEQPA
jgi:DHA1 family bicyclomycin/chloramphenicol resistance-like MFS transporter